jgi:flagellar protein FlgJ
MATELSAARVYTDFQGLAELRGQARQGSPQALEVAAKQFEAYLVQQLLRTGRDASLGDGIMDDKDADLYHDLFDKQIAECVSQGKGLGIAQMLVQQVQRLQGTRTATGAPSPARAAAAPAEPTGVAQQAQSAVQQQDSRPSAATVVSPVASEEQLKTKQKAAASLPAAADAAPVRFDNAQEFVAALMPSAQQVGAELGVDPRLLVAQAALETGWGKSIIHNSDGTSSHNLFNIKADRSWNGPVATARTLEYEQGAAVKVAAGFRSYTSFADSFRDYLHFLRSNPRYGEALQNTHDPVAYAQSLQAAGYATDPRYADKIMTIYGMNEVASAVG